MGEVPGEREDSLGSGCVGGEGEKEPWLGDEELVLGRSRCGERALFWDLAMTSDHSSCSF